MQPYYQTEQEGFLDDRNRAKEILQKEDELAEIVQLVGKSALGEPDKVTLDVAGLIKNDFLQQNGMSKYDRYCPFYKTSAMLKNFIDYYNCSIKAVESGDNSLTWAKVRELTSDQWYALSQMKFEDPADGKDGMVKNFERLNKEIHEKFRSLSE